MVSEVPMLNAAPLLRSRSRVSRPPSSRTWRSDSVATTMILEITSARYTAGCDQRAAGPPGAGAAGRPPPAGLSPPAARSAPFLALLACHAQGCPRKRLQPGLPDRLPHDSHSHMCRHPSWPARARSRSSRSRAFWVRASSYSRWNVFAPASAGSSPALPTASPSRSAISDSAWSISALQPGDSACSSLAHLLQLRRRSRASPPGAREERRRRHASAAAISCLPLRDVHVPPLNRS